MRGWVGVTSLVEVVLDGLIDMACLRVHELHRVKRGRLVCKWLRLQEMMSVLCQLLDVKADQFGLPSAPQSSTTAIYLYAKSAVLVSAALALPFPLSTAGSIIAVVLLEVQVLIRYAYRVVLRVLTRNDTVVPTRGQASLLLVIIRAKCSVLGLLPRIRVGVPFTLVI